MLHTSVFFPLRSGSSRVPNKNTRPFHPDGRSLFQWKIDQIAKIKDEFHEVVISTNDQAVIDQFPSHLVGTNIRIALRPDHLCTSKTKVQDLIDYVPTVTTGESIFWLHATSPFINGQDYLSALKLYESSCAQREHDSVMSVNRIQQFIWSEQERRIVNVDRKINPWPNTQELEPLFEINHAFYINSRRNYLEMRDRIGSNPALYCCEGFKRVDVDWQDDFDLAAAILGCIFTKDGEDHTECIQ